MLFDPNFTVRLTFKSCNTKSYLDQQCLGTTICASNTSMGKPFYIHF